MKTNLYHQASNNKTRMQPILNPTTLSLCQSRSPPDWFKQSIYNIKNPGMYAYSFFLV